jgi:hypothetical protein
MARVHVPVAHAPLADALWRPRPAVTVYASVSGHVTLSVPVAVPGVAWLVTIGSYAAKASVGAPLYVQTLLTVTLETTLNVPVAAIAAGREARQNTDATASTARVRRMACFGISNYTLTAAATIEKGSAAALLDCSDKCRMVRRLR